MNTFEQVGKIEKIRRMGLNKSKTMASFETEKGQFTIVVGMDERLAKKLAALPHSARHSVLHGQSATSEDFSEEGYEAWYEKTERIPLVLLDSDRNLVAIIWISAAEAQESSEAATEAQEDYLSMESIGDVKDEDLLKTFLKTAMTAYADSYPTRLIQTTTSGHGVDFSSVLTAAGFGGKESEDGHMRFVRAIA